MSTLFGVAALAEVLLLFVLLIRLVAGPTVSDRIVALNTMSTQAALATMCFAVYADRSVYLDVALWLASFSYLGTIVWGRYLERGLL
ncbi:MAG TPA: monovalent cation/H+ antiporter complex subunit F [Acidimicrobiia bacterium]|nr:monovalent cation/H+ antiporter complex subunit F [Acidimicrobiia bacterium]